MSELRFPEGGQTDTERIVGVRQIFFSTTDVKGIITGANQTFSDIARFGFDELMGAPHNLIRHNDMPAGVFRIMWDRLLAGEPIAAYVKNLAKDGRFYWVFATVTPVQGGFLSVRTRPVNDPLWEASKELYSGTRRLELEALARGGHRPEVAIAGKEDLGEGLRRAGFASFEDFMWAALPAEVMRREELSTAPNIVADAESPLGAVVGGAQMLKLHIQDLLGKLGQLEQISGNINEVLSRTDTVRQDLIRLANDAEQSCLNTPGLPKAIVNSSQAVREWTARAVLPLEATVQPLADVDRKIRKARFDIGLSSLHNEMVLSFAAEAQGALGGPSSLQNVPLLCHTMMRDTDLLAAGLKELQTELIQVGDRLDEANAAIQRVRGFLAAWGLAIARRGLEGQLSGIIRQIDYQQDLLHSHVASLAELTAAFYTVLQGVDLSGLAEPLPMVAYGALQLSSPGSK
ncbi:PAS domain-containing protein [Actinomycetaceae bacterium MB13-C1-2]|nr:PAS domain-containing protein [Actinomycetaceae bacterium MB13-C1-2]